VEVDFPHCDCATTLRTALHESTADVANLLQLVETLAPHVVFKLPELALAMDAKRAEVEARLAAHRKALEVAR
jgi:hypothetical protein